MATNCRYTPLVNPVAEVRVAVLQPGVYDDEICIRFQIRALQDTLPQYEALSYVWGSGNNPSHALINAVDSRVINITRKLDTALRHLRFESEPRLMWVDELCIDQHNNIENRSQVAIIGKVLSLAIRVIIWLGPAPHRVEVMARLHC